MEAVRAKKKAVVLKKETVEGPIPEAPTLVDLLLINDPAVAQQGSTKSSDLDPPCATAETGLTTNAGGDVAEEMDDRNLNSDVVLEAETSIGVELLMDVKKIDVENRRKEAEETGEMGEKCKENVRPPQNDVALTSSSSSKHEKLPAPIASIYPSLSTSTQSVDLRQIPRICVDAEPTLNVPHLYPSLVAKEAAAPSRAELMASATNEAELLSEQQLLEYYQNEQLEFVDDFVDVFVEQEIEPRNSLYELLSAYKDVCERVQNSRDLKTTTVEQLHTVNNDVWTVTEQRVVHRGKCGCERNASGESSYKVAQMHAEKLVVLKEAMDTLSECELEAGGFCGEVRSRAIALQIQWNIVAIGARFFTEHQLQLNSQAMLLANSSSLPSKPSRKALRGALSDLFYFLRFPMLPNRFRESVISWINELGSVLLKACTGDDQCFLLCHLLRCPSPIGPWGVALVQTFIDVPSLDQRRAMDNFVALLSLLMRNIEKREQFLVRVAKFYAGEDAWNLISEDGDSDCSNLADLTESDLVGLLSQFPIRPLLNMAFRHFTLLHHGHRLLTLYSLVAFVLILLKLLDEGLQTYAIHKNLSKTIADNISKIVHLFCAYWELVRGELSAPDCSLVQNEVNRIVLQAVYYIVAKKSDGIRQFLVEFPYATVSECCRLRCQLLLRSPPTRQAPTVTALYAIPEPELVQRVKNSGCFMDNIGSVNRASDELTYTVSTLAAIVSRSELELHHFVIELIDICFLNENLRENFYKVGSEAMAVLIERNPSLLGAVLLYIDRHVDHLDQYAVNILANVPLHICTVSAGDISDRLGKWLISRPVDDPASAIARKVLSALNWGCCNSSDPSPPSLHKSSSFDTVRDGPTSSSHGLWLPVEVHDLCAETLVKAHIAQCKQRNNLIAKSVNKAARLALKCPDMEQHFDKFCWDVLLRLKITERPNSSTPPNDLTAFYVFCVQKCLSSSNAFIETGLPYFQELVNASCLKAAVVLLVRLVHAFPSLSRIQIFIANPTFCEVVERLLHADESAYAIQLLIGADKFPGPLLSLMAGGIIHQISVDATQFEQRKQLAQAWLRILTCQKKTYEWNSDKFVLYLLGCVAKSCHLFDPQGAFGMVDFLRDLYKAQYQAWRDAARGPLSWFSSSMVPPALIASNQFLISPWATLMLLRAEQDVLAPFNFSLGAALAKHPNRNLDEALKKTCSRCSLQVPVDRLPFYRWAQFCCDTGSSTNIKGQPPHSVFPLALQQLAIAMFSRIHFEGRLYCPGWRFLHCKQADKLFNELRTQVLLRMEAKHSDASSSTTGDNGNVVDVGDAPPAVAPAHGHVLFGAVRHWLGAEQCFQPEMAQYGHLPMDYLLQMIIAGSNHIWAEFVDVERLKREQSVRTRLFDQICHLADRHPSPSSSPRNSPQLQHQRPFPQYANLTQLFSALDQQQGETVPFPQVPIHRNLPTVDRVGEPADVASRQILAKFGVYLDELNKTANAFLATREFVDGHNVKYAEQFMALYKESRQQLQILLHCGNILTARCPKPSVVEMAVTMSDYDQEVANKMNENRREREEELAKLLARSDALAITSARLEHICTQLNNLVSSGTSGEKSSALSLFSTQLFHIGNKLFYRLCASVQGDLLLFPAGMDAYETCLRRLGSAFIARNPAEQLNLMRVVLADNPLNHLLVDFFTPHCVQPPELLAQLYAELSASVRQTGTSLAALALLRRLDIKHAGRQLPPNQFRALMPVMFENLASVTGGSLLSTTPLRDLCMDHFVHAMFHRFPHNIVDALRLVLSGCDKQCVPPSLFVEIAKRLQVDTVLNEDHHHVNNHRLSIPSGANNDGIELGTEKARECFEVISSQLSTSRRELTGRLFTMWAPYLERVCALSDFFLRIYVNGIFRADASTATMESELAKAFRNAQNCYAPLLEPVPISNLPPWSANDVHLATGVLDRFIRHLLWLPYTLYIPPGSETPEALFWHYFSTRLVGDELRIGAQSTGSGLKHIYVVYENKLSSLNWARFWPTLIDLDRMDKLLLLPATGKGQNGELLAQLLAHIVVRLPWAQIVHQYQEGFQPEQARREFHSLLLAIFGKCVLRREHYTRSQASMCSLLKMLHDNCVWSFTKVEAVERNGLDDAQQCWQSIWRQACHFSTLPVPIPANMSHSELAIPRKRTIYIKTQLRFLFRPSSQIVERAEQLRHYGELLDRANFVLISAADKADYLDLAKEFVSVWAYYIFQQQVLGVFSANIKKCRAVVEALHVKLLEWLGAHPDSPLVLLLASTAMTALQYTPKDVQCQFGFGLLDACVGTYFKKNSVGQWHEISQWVRLPEDAKELIFTIPRSDSPGTEPHFLSLNAHLIREMAALGSPSDELKLVKKLGEFLASIKPKYMSINNNEPAFLLCADKWLRMCIRMFTNSDNNSASVSLAQAHEQLEALLSWLHRVHAEEGKGAVSFFSMVTSRLGRRTAFSTKLQLFTAVLYLFIVQQQTNQAQPPRLKPGQHVLNGRGGAFRDLQQHKARPAEYSLTDAPELFRRLAQQLYPGEPVVTQRQFERSIKLPIVYFQTLIDL
uniref:Ectopic P granules protein 5 homolog n=1 Tax=Globodera rostochiensis TaxID=31243 RepID=A0A914HKU6_GLORO